MFLFKLIGRLLYGPDYDELERRANNSRQIKPRRRRR
jgi:hypothetical protein